MFKFWILAAASVALFASVAAVSAQTVEKKTVIESGSSYTKSHREYVRGIGNPPTETTTVTKTEPHVVQQSTTVRKTQPGDTTSTTVTTEPAQTSTTTTIRRD